MSEDDIRKYLSRGGTAASKPRAPQIPRVRRRPAAPPQQEGYGDFSATHLLCPRCRRANPVRERLLLVLPDGDLYDYNCSVCGTSCGTRKAGRAP